MKIVIPSRTMIYVRSSAYDVTLSHTDLPVLYTTKDFTFDDQELFSETSQVSTSPISYKWEIHISGMYLRILYKNPWPFHPTLGPIISWYVNVKSLVEVI